MFRSSKLTAQLRLLTGLAGIIIVISIALPWFSASNNLASTSFSLVSLSSNIAGFQLGPNVTLSDTVASVVGVTLFFVLLGALLAFAGLRYYGVQAFGVIAILIGIVIFVVGLAEALAPLSLWGNMCFFVICASWGLSAGPYVAILGTLLMAVPLKDSNTRQISTNTTKLVQDLRDQLLTQGRAGLVVIVILLGILFLFGGLSGVLLGLFGLLFVGPYIERKRGLMEHGARGPTASTVIRTQVTQLVKSSRDLRKRIAPRTSRHRRGQARKHSGRSVRGLKRAKKKR
jgi:hypothetical protein